MRISDWSSDVCSSDLPVAERICTQGAVHAITETRACVRTLLHNQLPCQFRNRQKWVSGSSNFIGFARFAGRISNHCPNIGQRVSGLARHFAASKEFSGENRANGPRWETGVCMFVGETAVYPYRKKQLNLSRCYGKNRHRR